MKKINIAWGICLLLMATSCEVKFTPLPSHYSETKSPSSGNVGADTLTYIHERVLIKNYPRDTAKLVSMMLDYRDRYGKPYNSLLKKRNFIYIMNFYKDNRNTRKYYFSNCSDVEYRGKIREKDIVGYVYCRLCNGADETMNQWKIEVDINLNNSESYEYLGANYESYIIRDDCKEE